eukprot:snap_masked-scaffold_39-processed-gene-2.69-mRNA-1 protein AED:1.00 eAED:1.00 QI:0/0/0/0/1/1/2/0/60
MLILDEEFSELKVGFRTYSKWESRGPIIPVEKNKWYEFNSNYISSSFGSHLKNICSGAKF